MGDPTVPKCKKCVNTSRICNARLNLGLVLPLALAPIIVVVALYVFAMRSRYHYTSSLTCPNCHGTFEYKWVPMASFTSVRLGTSRYLQCPLCHEWGRFNIVGTRTKT